MSKKALSLPEPTDFVVTAHRLRKDAEVLKSFSTAKFRDHPPEVLLRMADWLEATGAELHGLSRLPAFDSIRKSGS